MDHSWRQFCLADLLGCLLTECWFGDPCLSLEFGWQIVLQKAWISFNPTQPFLPLIPKRTMYGDPLCISRCLTDALNIDQLGTRVLIPPRSKPKKPRATTFQGYTRRIIRRIILLRFIVFVLGKMFQRSLLAFGCLRLLASSEERLRAY